MQSTLSPVWRDQWSEGSKDRLEATRDVLTISGITSELTDVLVNIIANAIDAMPDGGTIQISSGSYQAENNDYAEIKIKDTGIGMSNEVRQKVFDPFFSTKGPKGTGLGMSVAYGIVARHHGNIALESELGQGTTCMLYFPAATQAERANRARSAPMEKQKIRILVIDDEDVIRDFLAEMFVTVGHEAELPPLALRASPCSKRAGTMWFSLIWGCLICPGGMLPKQFGQKTRKCRLFC
jgi:hypothetical protein